MAALSSIARLFPPPRFMKMPSAGIDISDTSLKYIQFKEKGSALELFKWGDIDVPDGVVARGDVKDQKKLTEVLGEAKAACGAEYVRVSLPEERAYLFETAIKRNTPYKDIRGMLEFKLEENVPLSPRDAFFDYDIVEDDVDDQVLRIGVAVYARETILNYYNACRDAGMVPLSFEVEAQAITHAAVPRGDQGTHMIIDFGKTRTGIGIVHRRSLMYTSTIDIGGRELSTAMRSVLGDVAESELTKLKNERGLLRTGDSEDMLEAILPVMEKLKEELEARVAYWNTSTPDSTDDRTIKKLILCGGSSNLAGLPEYLTETIGIEAGHAEVWQNAFSIDKTVPPITRRYSYGYATAIGLALKGLTPDI